VERHHRMPLRLQTSNPAGQSPPLNAVSPPKCGHGHGLATLAPRVDDHLCRRLPPVPALNRSPDVAMPRAASRREHLREEAPVTTDRPVESRLRITASPLRAVHSTWLS
jgi:hypothetical protein